MLTNIISNMGYEIIEDSFWQFYEEAGVSALIFDDNLTLIHFMPTATKYFNEKTLYKGNSYQNIIAYFNNINFADELHMAQSKKEPIDRFVFLEEQRHSLRILPEKRADDSIRSILVNLMPISVAQTYGDRLNLMAGELQEQGLLLLDKSADLRQKAAEISQQKELLEAILGSMGEGLLVLDKEGQIVQINKAFTNITAIGHVYDSLESWLNDCHFYYPKNQTQKIKYQDNPFIKAISGNCFDKLEMYVEHRKTKAYKYIQLNVKPLSYSDDTIQNGVVIVVSDITKKKEAEIELRHSEQHQKALLEAIPDTMFHIRRDGTILNYIPSKDEGIIPAAAFIENTFYDILDESEAAKLMNTLYKTLDSAQLQTCKFECCDAHELQEFYEARFSPLNQDEALIIVRKITDMITVEEALQKSYEHYEMLLDSCPLPIVLVSRKGIIINANARTLEALLLTEKEALIDKNINDFLPSYDEKMKAKSAIKMSYTDEVPKNKVTYKVVRNSGTVVKVNVSASMILYKQKQVLQVMIEKIHS
ncbi:MAG: PAS domain-containing protein [Chitinophagales bacterium]